MAEPRATLVVATGASWSAAIAQLGLPNQATPAGTVQLLPASLQRDDPLAAAVLDALPSQIVSRLVVPANPAWAIVTGRSWTRVRVDPPDVPASTITLPARLLAPATVWTVTDVDAVAGRGPYVLDLVARHLHPRSRLRLLASPRRADAVVDVNLVAGPARCIVGKRLGDGILVGMTGDPIAGELFALALADEVAGSGAGRDRAGPWQERVVQRAGELQLGIQIPRQLSIIAGAVDQPARDAVRRAAERIGIAYA